MTQSVMRTQNLAKTYVLGFFRKKVAAIQDVTISVPKGSIFGLLGPNGAGKTTTLKVLMGLIRPTSGSAEVLGQPVGDLDAKRRLGYLPESPYFYDYLTGQELLIFVGQLCGLTRGESARRADRLLVQVGLGHARQLALRRYSKGMLQRVGLAQALINNPELVVLDEPLTGLDPLGRKHLRELIAELRAAGKTVVLSSHILSDVELLADEVAILVHGRSVATGPLHELVDARILSTEVVYSAGDEALGEAVSAAGFSPEEVGDTSRVVVGDVADVNQLIDLLRARGAAIHAVTPRKESLEDVVVGQATAGDAEDTAAAEDAEPAEEPPQRGEADEEPSERAGDEARDADEDGDER